MFPLLFHASGKDSNYLILRDACMESLKENPFDAVSLLTMASNESLIGEALYHVEFRDDQFHCQANCKKGTELFKGEWIKAGRKKDAQQTAALSLLAALTGIKLQGLPINVPSYIKPKQKVVTLDTKKGNYVSGLQEYTAQSTLPNPQYSFDKEGADHCPVIKCTCEFLEFKCSETGKNKKEAKQLAAKSVCGKLLEENASS